MLKCHQDLGTLIRKPGTYGYSNLAKTGELVDFQSFSVLCFEVQTDGRVGVGLTDGKREALYLLSVFCKFPYFINKGAYFKISWWINNL